MESTKNPQNRGEANEVVEYATLMEGAAVVDLPKTILRLNGKDPVGMLNAVLTNVVPEEDNLGVYALLLNPKGRIQTDLRIIKVPSGEGVLAVTEPEGAEAAKEILGRYAPFSRVNLEELPDWKVLGLYGPDAASIRDVGFGLSEHESAEVENNGTKLLAVGVATPVPGFDHLGPADMVGAVRERLIERGAIPASLDAYETARIEAGIPRFGSDITPENFPAEAEYILERAVSFEKGCYPGQETVARMRYRGHPNKLLHRFALEGPPPPPDAAILQDGKQVGKVTSVAPLPVNGETLALGYLSRNADARGELHAGNATLLPLA
jgi:tRNA-modifying protein YgfZ